MNNEFEAAQEYLESIRCTVCNGSGECNDAEPGDIDYNSWTCTECNGEGVV